MFKETLSKAINYYETFHDILIADQSGIIEYSAIYDLTCDSFVNEDITGMHILDAYPELTEKTSTILECIRTGRPVYDSFQKLTNIHGITSYFVNTDFPIISKGSTIGVIEVSQEISEKEFLERLDSNKDHGLYISSDIKTDDPTMKEILSTIQTVADSQSPVLIVGETGTGKDMVAQALHTSSYRRNSPFIVQNCAAIPATLLEATFFGTVKGAFTGAENKPGIFDIADGGTIFLDEINSMDIYLQAKLLKVVEDKCYRPLGSTIQKTVDVRIISAMNGDPLELIKNGKFREDLYYRLSVVRLDIPPLRKRKKDIKFISNYFIHKFNHIFNKNVQGISAIAEKVLEDYRWSGNVRELQNVLENIFNFIDKSYIHLEDLPRYLYNDDNKISAKPSSSIANGRCEKFIEMDNRTLKEKMDSYEKHLILQAISGTHNLMTAATKLGISPPLLSYKMKKHKLRSTNKQEL